MIKIKMKPLIWPYYVLKIGPKIVYEIAYTVDMSKKFIDLGFDLYGVLCAVTCHGDLRDLKILKKIRVIKENMINKEKNMWTLEVNPFDLATSLNSSVTSTGQMGWP
jgi:hypothetical protein